MRERKSKKPGTIQPLKTVASLKRDKVLNPESLAWCSEISTDAPVLVVLAAGKGTRFGREPKCVQLLQGKPLARHSIDAFRQLSRSPVICIVGYRYGEVSSALGADNIYIRSDNSTGGTAFAAFEAFCVPGLVEKNPLLVITMGDRVVPAAAFQRLWETHCGGVREADLTLLTAQHQPPRNRSKGRVVRDKNQRVIRVVEERDIAVEKEEVVREQLLKLTEGNCSLYLIRAVVLMRYLQELANANAQGQYYLTDIIQAISRDKGDIRTVTTSAGEMEYDLLCSDVTRAEDLALLESILTSTSELAFAEETTVEQAVRAIRTERPAGQVASIARQLEELISAIQQQTIEFKPDRPIGIGISGGRLRIAFMHTDMARFLGPAWQMPLGAETASGEEQIVMLVQDADDGRIHVFPTNPKYRERVNSVASDDDAMYPGEEISDVHSYEEFGTRLSEKLLLSLRYYSDDELQRLRKEGLELPSASRWVSSNMRRPFCLVGNAIASIRTLRKGTLAARVQQHLGRENFRGLRLVCTGNIPQGGFASSSAVTVASLNAINALYDLGISDELLVQLACQAEYGTGVHGGSLDQATEQKGRAEQGTLISSNRRDNYNTIGIYPVPSERFHIFFPYSVERDQSAWQWSWGAYGEETGSGALTTTEVRKLTGKAAECAAILTRLPLATDFFKQIEDDLVSDGLLSHENRSWICSVLRQLPLLVRKEELRERVLANWQWYVEQLVETFGEEPTLAIQKANATLRSLFGGWRDPLLRRTTAEGTVMLEAGVPLRAMVAYLFGEVAKNFYLIHHPEQWIEYVTWSQRGDRCVEIVPDRLPDRDVMEGELEWERGSVGPELMNRWLERFGATPFDYNRGLDDETLSAEDPPEFHRLEGSNFFRGLALIDLVEAMLKRAFGSDAVAVRVNAAGQGDYFQVHVDREKVQPEAVKQFLRVALYRRFDLTPVPEFVEVHAGGGALGVRLHRYDALQQLVGGLRSPENTSLELDTDFH